MAGCATSGDLEKLKAELQGSSADTKKELEQKMTPIAQAVETLKGETKAGIEETRKQIEERERLLTQDIKAQQEAVKKVDALVNATQATLAELSGKTDALAKDSVEFRAALKSSNRSIRDLLKAQEAAYQEALRSIRATLSELGGLDEKPR
jgi:chromosome segregation ATPase